MDVNKFHGSSNNDNDDIYVWLHNNDEDDICAFT